MNMSRRHLNAALLSSAFAGLLSGSARAADEFLNVLTGGTSGVYYPLGVALSKIFAEKIPGVRPSVQATKASVENLILLQQGKGEIAFTLGDSLAFAWAGDEEAGFKTKLDKLRGVAAIYPNFIQIVASAESGIKTLADLKGKRLSVGAPKSGTELNARAILSGAGESVDLMKNRQLDATLQSAGLGVAAIRDLASSLDITVVEVPGALVDKVGAPYVKAVIPANTYTGQTRDVQAAAVVNYLVTREGLSDSIVYQMVKCVFDQRDELVSAHQAASDIKLENALQGMPIPVHPGAQKYFREKGLLK